MMLKWTAAAIMALVIGPAVAQEAKRDPKVQALMDQTVAAYKALNSFHEKIVMVPTVSSPELTRQYSGPTTVEIKVQKPNKVWVDSQFVRGGKQNHSVLVSDGTSLWRWQEGDKTFTKTKAPASLVDFGKFIPRDTPELDILFRGKDPFADFKVGMGEVSLYMGPAAKVGDIDTESLEARIAPDGSPIQGTLRIRIGQKDRFVREVMFEGGGKDPQTNKDMSFKFQLTYPVVEGAPTFTPADFTFASPPGIKAADAVTPKPAVPAKQPVKPNTKKKQ